MRRNKKESVGFGTSSVVSSRPLGRLVETRALEDDLILFSNLKLLGFEEALQQWPEFSLVKTSLTQNMFSAPNRVSMEAIVYFLDCCLTSREATKKTFKDIWPPKTLNQIREFRLRVFEKIKDCSVHWGISTDSIQVLAGLLQRNGGQKLVRLLCELSYAALKPMNSEDEIGSNEIICDRLIEAQIHIGKTKIVKLQRQFLQLIVDGKSHHEEVRNSASKIISKHADLDHEIEVLKMELDAITSNSELRFQSCTNEHIQYFISNWRSLISLLTDFEDLGSLVQTMTETVGHPNALSGERLLVLMSKSFGERPVDLGIRTDDEERSTLESDWSFPTGGFCGKTQVDVLSMLEFWVHCGVSDLISLLKVLMEKNSSTKWVKELMYKRSIPDVISQTRDSHKRHLEEMKILKYELQQDIAKLNEDIEIEETKASAFWNNKAYQAPTLLSSLRN
eukprot:g6096.t1